MKPWPPPRKWQGTLHIGLERRVGDHPTGAPHRLLPRCERQRQRDADDRDLDELDGMSPQLRLIWWGWALLFGGSSGLVNKALMNLGLASSPLPFMFTETGVIVALTHVLMPYMVLAVWASLQRLDPQVENAAIALGAGPFTVLRRIVLPQVMPGILSGAVIVFALAASAFATPAIIGGRRLKVASTLAYDEFLNTLNWPLGAAVAVLLLFALVAIVWSANRLVERRYAQVFA